MAKILMAILMGIQGGKGQDNPNWNVLGGYRQPRQYQGWNPMGPFLPHQMGS